MNIITYEDCKYFFELPDGYSYDLTYNPFDLLYELYCRKQFDDHVELEVYKIPTEYMLKKTIYNTFQDFVAWTESDDAEIERFREGYDTDTDRILRLLEECPEKFV